METVRSFIAIDLGDEIRTRLDELQRKLKKVHAPVRWTKPNNIHLTLAFLGELPLEKINPLETALHTAYQSANAFELNAHGAGYFGRPNRPRVIWAGVASCPPLMALQQKTVEALQGVAVEFDNKPFSPHLTLGRIKAANHTESLLGKIEHYKDIGLGSTWVDAVELIKSEPIPHGMEYTVLRRIALLRQPG